MFKYDTEACLEMFVDNSLFLDLQSIYDGDIYDEEKYHIYTILSRPRSTFTKAELMNRTVIGEVEFGNEYMQFAISMKDIPESLNLNLTFNKAMNTLYIIDSNECVQRQYLAEKILKDVHAANGKSYCVKVLYIGQSQGKDGTRSVRERLKNHQTLQRILSDYHTDRINDQLFIGMFSFNSNLITLFNGWEDKFSASDKEQGHHLDDLINESIDFATGNGDKAKRERQMINITEAALIYYFKPDYNEKFVNMFPSESHYSYNRFYLLEYNSLAITLNLNPPFVLYNGKRRIEYSESFCIEDDNLIYYNLHGDGRKGIISLFE